MASVTVVATEHTVPLSRLLKSACRPWLCALVFLASDGVAITASWGVAMLVTGGGLFRPYLQAWPALGVVLLAFAWYNLYPGVIHNAACELRRLTFGVSTGFVVMASAIFLTRYGAGYSRRGFLLWWLLAIVAAPVVRSLVRRRVCRRGWWGVPLAVLYTGDASLEMLREMEEHPEMGLKPVVMVAGPHAIRNRLSVPVVGIGLGPSVRSCGIHRMLIALPAAGLGNPMPDLETVTSVFPRLMIMHGSPALYSLTMGECSIAGSIGVEVKRDLLLPLPRLAKRAMDLLISCLGLPVVGLTLCLLGLLVWLESPGPVFFGHRRIGRGNATFRAWKLRTMRVNSEQLLQEALSQDGNLREEWLRHRKLRRDPRITRVGRVLRKTSLDELPQLWNVLRGEMSLVGPRPIVAEEVAGYGPEFSLYCRVTPGITGLWQVSGRNMVSTRDRVRLDSYYVRNWSPWLDLHILARTAKAVLTGKGAY